MRGFELIGGSQSHRTAQGNSKYYGRKADREIAEESQSNRTAQAIPRFKKSRHFKAGRKRVAIPTCCSGQFQALMPGDRLSDAKMESQSNRTAQGDSKHEENYDSKGPHMHVSQSHHTAQGDSKEQGCNQPHDGLHLSQSHCTDQGNSKDSSIHLYFDYDITASQSHRTAQGNSKVLLGTDAQGRHHHLVAIPPHYSGQFQDGEIKYGPSTALAGRNPTVLLRAIPRSTSG